MGSHFEVDALALAVAGHRPRLDPRTPPLAKAAVAAVLREAAGGADLLLIRRAEHPRDPWSGQMGLPGGRVEPGDADLAAAAVRETAEELALDLGRDARLLGPLSEVRTHLRSGRPPQSVAPFVFALVGAPSLVLNSEVQEAVWVPLAVLADPARRGSLTWVRRGVPLPMPCVRHEGRTIWGLTLRIVDQLVALATGGGPAAP